MTTNCTFWKMHGAGNDFVLFDDRTGVIPAEDADWLAHIAARRTGIGGEGIILLQDAAQGDVRMRFYNPDGRAAAMCGNGARCAARLAYELGMAPASMTIVTDAGLVSADVGDDAVTLALPAPTDVQAQCAIEIDGTPIAYGRANTGVPHIVIEVEDLAHAPVASLGALLRHHSRFAPAGTNVNFVRRPAPSHLTIRTYERGVESETGACGTGATAAAIVMALRKGMPSPITVSTPNGQSLRIRFALHEGTVSDVCLTGPAVRVYKGQLDLPHPLPAPRGPIRPQATMVLNRS